MNDIIKILMRRDSMSKQEATDYYKTGKEYIMDEVACGNYEKAEDIMLEYFGLEMDYIFCIIQ